MERASYFPRRGSPTMETNKRIGDYEILGELGRGGMGRVYRVRNVIAGRVEAMKVLLPDLAGQQDVAARFLREIKLLAALDHPHIAALRTALTADNQLVMIMEYIEGQSLAERLAQGPIPLAETLSYLDQVLDALGYAHQRGVIHRDIKPANMMVTPAGVVKLTDFGIARSAGDETITVAGTTTGSLSYMAPEQVSGQATDARSDLYSVGISLYEMVTGQRPFRADNNLGVMLAHLQQSPQPPIELQPSLPPALNEIILRTIAKPPAARFQSADELRQALQSVSRAAGYAMTFDATTLALPASGVTSSQSPVASSQSSVASSRLPVTSSQVPVASRQSPAPVMRSGHPLLFVALGAVLVITALVGTGLYLGRAAAEPGRSSATAPATTDAADPPIDSTTPSADADAPAATVDRDAVTPPTTVPSTEVSAAAGGAHSLTSRPADPPVPARQPPSPQRSVESSPTPAPRTPASSSPPSGSLAGTAPSHPPSASAAAPDPDAAELDAIEGELDQLMTRAAAITSSLDRLQQQQARQGLGLRGDITGRQESMRINLSRAQEAVGRRDAARARKHRDTARADIEALERFLGR